MSVNQEIYVLKRLGHYVTYDPVEDNYGYCELRELRVWDFQYHASRFDELQEHCHRLTEEELEMLGTVYKL